MISNQASIGGRRVCSALSGEILEIQREGKLDGTDREKCGTGGAENVELFVFTVNLFLESVFYKGTSKSTLLFLLVLRLHQVQMKGELILQIVHIAEKRMIDEGIHGLSRGNKLGGVMRGLEPLQYSPLGKQGTEILDNLYP